jgi:hypothetical protein
VPSRGAQRRARRRLKFMALEIRRRLPV